jgi:hypothetical protein
LGRTEERLFRINDEIAALRRDEMLAHEELIMLRHLDDNARRDAVVTGSPMDTVEARATAGDVARMERHVTALRSARRSLERKRDRFMGKLGG